jgi:lysophospholipase L1-like esterase
MARLFIPQASNATFSATGGLNAGFDALYPDALSWQTRQQVDGVGTPANLTSTSEGATVAFHSLQFRSTVANATVLGIGDSITSGFAGTVQQNNWGWRAVNALRSAGVRASWLNGGHNGQTTTQFLARGKSLAAAAKPQVAIYSAFSPNDGVPTLALINTAWANVLDFLDWASTNRIVPVVTTPVPWGTLTGPQDAFRVQLRDRVLGLRAQGVDVIDFDAATSTQASPARWLPGMGDGDKHPIDAGHAAMATAVQAVLAAILAR